MATKSALLVIDMLEDFVRPGAPLEVPRTRDILPALRRRVSRARREGSLVVYVCDSHGKHDPEFARMGWPPHAVAGTKGAAVVREIAPEPGDVVVEKKTYSGFHRTSLHSVLRRHGVRSVSLAGCVTNICILYTAADAAMRGYDVSVDESVVAGLDEPSHRFALDQMEKVLGVRVIRRA
ncbi:MAG TPA: isochorismatase family cysteine hydrolase [Candidatus Deferrimicrobiaceae bacterium]|nr:isochorismatase family cysteine hydrolase [Candidatus Deferrimicrobiaceae bacterium]